jgi:chromate transporter
MLYFLKLGITGFGGPVALVGYMQRDLVERKKWIDEEDYKEGLALAQLAPGPLAAQLAIYMGYVHYRIIGATIIGVTFVLPSFLMVVGLGWLYVHFGGLPWMQAVFYGVGACIIGIIANSAYKLTKRTIGKDWLLWIIYSIAAIVTIITKSENILLFIGAGIITWFIKAPPGFIMPGKTNKKLAGFIPFMVLGTVAVNGKLLSIFLFFAKAGAFVFGSGLAIVPFLYGGVVKEYHWLTERQFIDAVAVAMVTPGPVVITVGFIGYLVAGLPGAIIAALGTFLPCYLFTIIPAPYFKKYGKLPSIKAFIDGVTSAAIGAITGAVVVLGMRSLTDLPTVIIAIVSGLLLWRFKKIEEPFLIIAAAFVGLLLKLVLV